ncbi:MAG: SDR family oxidoreductase [Pacificimonas sp.]
MTSDVRPLALVTGGTQRLGAAIAGRLATAGYDLALHYNSQAELDPALAATIERSGVNAARYQADLGEPGSAAVLFDAIAKPVSVLVNSASLFGRDTLTDTDQLALANHFAVNAGAPALLSQQFAARLPEGEMGTIVNMLDQRLAQPHGDNFAYTVSKFALAGLTELLARTLAPRIRVNAVAPGLTIPTEDYRDDDMARATASMPLARLPSPEEVADAVAWLVGAESVTGQTIAVDGGARHVSFRADFDRLNDSS